MSGDLAQPGGRIASLSVFGGLSISLAGRDIKIKSSKSRAVVAYLALTESLTETRERLAGLLWSEADENKARQSLRQTLRDLRLVFETAGYDGFETGKLSVGFNRHCIDIDLWAVIREAGDLRAHPLLLSTPRLAECLLDGLEDLDPSFRIWLLAKRQTLHDRLVRALAAGLSNEAIDRKSRIRLAEAIVNLDPTHEEACRHLMRARAETGDTAGALSVYKTLWDLLGEEYDTEPSAQTQELVAEIKTGALEIAFRARSSPPDDGASTGNEPRDPLPRESRPPERPAERRITRVELSVDFFEMRGVERDYVHLAHGFRQNLIANLVRFREWYVTGRSSDPATAAARLPVGGRYALRTLARQGAEGLRLLMVLIELSNNLYIWSDEFELKLDNWFESQQRIVRRIAMSLNVHVSTERLMRFAAEPDVSLDLYDRWLRGRSMLDSFGAANRRRAAEIFAGVIREAPHFSPAYSSLAQINNADHIAYPGVFRTREKERQSLELARTAVQLDPLDSRAHLSLAWSLIMAKHYAQAEGPIALACELNANDPWTLISSAHVLAFCASFDRARGLARDALDLSISPSASHWGYQATIHFLLGEYDGCVEAATQAGNVLSGLSAWVASALFHLGRPRDAAEEARRFLVRIRANWYGSLSPTDETIMRWLLHLYPIRRREDWERLRDGLAGAGVPVHGMDHHAW
jgi:DNA-binding SARP family transcriptional activator/TolB-like protein